MIIEHISQGGPIFMVPIALLWIATIVTTIWLLARHFAGNGELVWLKKQVNLVLFLGSFAFLLGLLAQVIGLIMAFEAIEAAGDVSMAIIAGGLRISFIAPFYGFVLFMLSLLVWFVVHNYMLRFYTD